MEEVNWRLNLQLAQSSMSKMKEPNAMFELGVRDENTGVGLYFAFLLLLLLLVWFSSS